MIVITPQRSLWLLCLTHWAVISQTWCVISHPGREITTTPTLKHSGSCSVDLLLLPSFHESLFIWHDALSCDFSLNTFIYAPPRPWDFHVLREDGVRVKPAIKISSFSSEQEKQKAALYCMLSYSLYSFCLKSKRKQQTMWNEHFPV